MRFVTAFALVIGILLIIFLFGCTDSSNGNVISPPYSTCQFITRALDQNGNHLDCSIFYAGGYSGFLKIDGNNISLTDVNGATPVGDINWSSIVGFPSPCLSYQAVQVIGASLTCVDINAFAGSSIDTNTQTAGWTNANGVWNGIDLNVNGKNIYIDKNLVVGSNTLFANSTTRQVGIGTTAPVGKLNVLSTTEQLRLAYDINNYYSAAVSSIGTLNQTLTGTNPNFAFNSAPTSVNQGSVRFMDTSAVAINNGAYLTLGGKYTGSTTADWAGIKGGKENAVDGNYAGYLGLWTRANGASMTEKFRITSTGNVGIGTTTPAYKLDVTRSFNLGSDSGVDTRTNNTAKYGYFGSPHYANAEEPLMNFWNYSGSTDNIISYGGGSSAYNAATMIRWYTGATNTTVTGTERMRITSGGLVGIGTTAPASTNGGLDIASGGLSLILGADNVATTRTNATVKYGRIGAYHYTNAEEPIGVLLTDSTATENILHWGGGSGLINAATNHRFYTAANTTTTTGTEKMRITSAGDVGIGTTAPAEKLHVNGNILLNDNNKLMFGDAKDATISYTGTDLNINPKSVGTGKVNVQGNLNVDSNYMVAGVNGITRNMTVTQGAGTCDLNFVGGILIGSTC